MLLQTKIAPTIIAAAAVLVTDRCQHLPPRTSTLPENNCPVCLPWRGLVMGACIREEGKCRVPAPMTVGPIATPAT